MIAREPRCSKPREPSIREKGHARTTLAAVARRAGMTTGAIYGNFKNRDELFIALGQAYWAPVKPRIKPGATFAEAMHAMANATLEAIPERTTAAVGRLTGLAYALTSSGFARASSRDHRRQLRAWRGMAAHIRR